MRPGPGHVSQLQWDDDRYLPKCLRLAGLLVLLLLGTVLCVRRDSFTVISFPSFPFPPFFLLTLPHFVFVRQPHRS